MKVDELIFALDIGTRTVIGALGYMKDEKWVVVKSVCMEHQERAMLDGQVHDIEKVAHVVKVVKEQLEKQINDKLKKVNIAAAGRVLNTEIAYVQQDFEDLHEMNVGDIQNIQLKGIDEAKMMLEKAKKIKSSEYFCVGHTVISYFVDNYMISNPEGHKGQVLSAKILATFLPKSVIESLYAVTNRVGLEVGHLTLEPIAAINAIIPEQIRLLNLALVDIGAGTSDIAITKEGSVMAYGMIPVAGDEVTEAIVHQYLVDFNTAERIKQTLTVQDQVEYEDVIGLPNVLTAEELTKCTEPIIHKLAKQISKKILELNGRKATNAVFCVGGGSQMPGLIEKLAQELQLPAQRVAMRQADQIQNVVYECEMSKGPEMITPIGIGITACLNIKEQFTHVTLNGKPVTLINTKKLTVLDVLLQAGIEHTKIFPIKGKTLMFKLGGKRVRIKGSSGEAASLFLNNAITSIDKEIQEGDELSLVPAKMGKDGKAQIKNYINPKDKKTLVIDGEKMTFPIAVVNGDVKDIQYAIEEGDVIELLNGHTVKELLEALGKEECIVTVNGETSDDATVLKDEDEIIFLHNEHQDVKEEVAITLDEVQVKSFSVEVNGEWIDLPEKEGDYLFVNIFDYIEFDLSKPKGNIMLTLNGERAAVTDVLSNGDHIQIYWQK